MLVFSATWVQPWQENMAVIPSASAMMSLVRSIQTHVSLAAALNALVDGSQATIDSLATVLEDILVARGLYNPTTEQNLKVEFKGHEAGALYNFKFVTEDKSRGVHNFKLSKALLTNSIASLQ